MLNVNNAPSISPSLPSMINTHVDMGLNQKAFFKQFSEEKTKTIATDEDAYVDFQSQKKAITSYEIGDCITIFALEKENNKNKSLIGWHISNGGSVHDIVEELEGYEQNNPYEIYIVGGTTDTVTGHGCLLENIKEAIKTVFNNHSKIKLELVDLDKSNLDYISANMHLDGTLTICRHNAL